MEQKTIVLLTPTTGNGGIASWSRKYLKQFVSETFRLIPVNRAAPQSAAFHNSLLHRIWVGLKELLVVLRYLRQTVHNHDVAIIHATTSGSIGTVRDFLVTFHSYHGNSRLILQNRYGCIAEDMQRSVYGRFLRYTMARYDQVWVLDSRSEACLKKYASLKDKVYLVPNCIDVNPMLQIPPKSYRNFAFIANLIPEKGLFELVEAFLQRKDDAKLSIVGSGSAEVEKRLRGLAQPKLNKTIYLFGQLANEEAMRFMQTIDVVVLPTYMPQEAFPISILEAMSLGKLVISTRRAAIGDMLTALDGSPCGIFVRERSVEDIVAAIDYCISHPADVDLLCKKAHQKVCRCYATEVVYKLYEERYKELTEV